MDNTLGCEKCNGHLDVDHEQVYVCLDNYTYSIEKRMCPSYKKCHTDDDPDGCGNCAYMIQCDKDLAPLIAALNRSGIETIYSCVGACDIPLDDEGLMDMENTYLSNTYILYKYNKLFTELLVNENRPYMDIRLCSNIVQNDNDFYEFLGNIENGRDLDVKHNNCFPMVEASVSYYIPEDKFYPGFIEKYFDRCRKDFIKTFRSALEKYNKLR